MAIIIKKKMKIIKMMIINMDIIDIMTKMNMEGIYHIIEVIQAHNNHNQNQKKKKNNSNK